MKKNLKWYLLIIISTTMLFGYVLVFKSNIKDSFKRPNISLPNQEGESVLKDSKLVIPQILENKSTTPNKAEFDLVVEYGEKEFIKGYVANTLGYNGDYLGPVIRVNKGDEVVINVNNQLKESTTVHWHGLKVDAIMDGGPHQVILSKTTWKPNFTIEQPAATLWYHPHLMHKTGEQVYEGLAGMFIIDDEYSQSLNIPKDYGVNDIPIIVQDKRFTSKGQIPYNLNMQDLMNGFMGDTVVINGTINPQLEVKNEVIRLRVLNGSNARTYNFNFSDNNTFYQIASDGGFLESSVEMSNVTLAPAERAEILLDLSAYKVGDILTLKDGNLNLMTIKISEESFKEVSIPTTLISIENYDINNVVNKRKFVMSGMGPMVNINGRQMDLNYINEQVKINNLEEWTIINNSSQMGMMGRNNSTPHPFHIHGAQFRVIQRNNQMPPLNEQGWKDTVMLNRDEEVKILIKFSKKGLFMYHCHILEHEDSGMMGQLLVE